MNQANESPAASSPSEAETLFILELMTRPGMQPSVSPKVRFLAMLVMLRSATLRSIDIEELAQAMLDWSEEAASGGL